MTFTHNGNFLVSGDDSGTVRWLGGAGRAEPGRAARAVCFACNLTPRQPSKAPAACAPGLCAYPALCCLAYRSTYMCPQLLRLPCLVLPCPPIHLSTYPPGRSATGRPTWSSSSRWAHTERLCACLPLRPQTSSTPPPATTPQYGWVVLSRRMIRVGGTEPLQDDAVRGLRLLRNLGAQVLPAPSVLPCPAGAPSLLFPSMSSTQHARVLSRCSPCATPTRQPAAWCERVCCPCAVSLQVWSLRWLPGALWA